MFGYIVCNRREMKIKDYELYRSWYCGLCRELRERYGLPGQLTLSYDLTFLILLLSGVYEPGGLKGKTRCAVQPFFPHEVRKNIFTEYAADMNVLLTYYKCQDDWKDEKKILRLAYAKLLEGNVRSLEGTYQEKIRIIAGNLAELSRKEKQRGAKAPDLDEMAGLFGRIMAQAFAWKEDEWYSTLWNMGFYLGKFVYLLDAYDDIEKDSKTGNYNPFAEEYKIKGSTDEFEQRIRSLLIMMLSAACREFEMLPILPYGDILRNILYSGVWCRFEKIRARRREEREKTHA